MHAAETAKPKPPINWVTSIFLVGTPLVALVWGVLHGVFAGVGWPELAVLAFFVAATGMSITAGYHRLFAHGAYDCHRVVKIFFLLFGAAAFQHSVLSWASDHRRHHKNLDGDHDPYNIHRGFWWAHIGWLLVQDRPEEDFSNVPDLARDPWVRFQHDHYVAIAIAVGFLLPLGIGWAVGHPWGFLLWGGFIRVVLVHHSTFLVNSLAHTLGRKTYCLAVSARDSVVTALLTFGEGYHNFHHRFATDYRNGVRRHQWDPTKWLIAALEATGFAWSLSRTPREKIVAAEIECELVRLASGGKTAADSVHERCAGAQALVQRSAERLGQLERQLALAGRSLDDGRRRQVERLRADYRHARREFRTARERWRQTLEELAAEGFAPERA